MAAINLSTGRVRLLVFGLLMTALIAIYAGQERWAQAQAPDFLPSRRGIGLLVVAGIVYLLGAWRLVKKRSTQPSGACFTLPVVLVAAAAMRILISLTPPLDTNDYERYLWDGAVTANGLSPYLYPPGATLYPDAAQKLPRGLKQLAADSGGLPGRIRQPYAPSLYPPVAQGFFALAHTISPFRPLGWRIILLLADAAAAFLVFLLLRERGLSLTWLALYLFNPLLIIENCQVLHLDALLVVLLMLFACLLHWHRPGWAALVLALAVGVKLWPIFLLPFLIARVGRHKMAQWKTLGIFGGVCAWLMLPYISALMEHTGGFTSLLKNWRTPLGLYPALERMVMAVSNLLMPMLEGQWLAFWGVLIFIFYFCVIQAGQITRQHRDLFHRVGLAILLIALIQPASYPWCFVGLIPLAAVSPRLALLLPSALMPLVYLLPGHSHRLLWGVLIQLPLWIGLVLDSGIWSRRKPEAAEQHQADISGRAGRLEAALALSREDTAAMNRPSMSP